MASLYMNYPMDSACPFHRLLLPARFCAPDFEPMGHKIAIGDALASGHDAIMFHGVPNNTAILEIAKHKRRGARFVWSLDDDWTSIPPWNPACPSEDNLAQYDLAQMLADLIVVSTEGVKKAMAHVADKVMVAPNMLDLRAFPAPPPWEMDAHGKPTHAFTVSLPVRVAWVGGHTHAGDIPILEGVIDKMLRKFGKDKVAFIFMGMSPPASLLRDHLHRGLFFQPPVPFANYQSTIASIKADVYLAPLAEIPFNESKSNLRLIEGWALMACPIATDIGEYSCIRNGIDGRLVTTEDQWVSALSRVVTDHEYRLQLAVAGRQRVEESFDWNKFECRRPWHEVFARIFDCDLPTRRE